MHARMHRKENSFDCRRRHSLPVIADAHIQPLSHPADNNEVQAPGPSARIAVRVGPHSPPAVGARKVALEPPTIPDRWSLLPLIGFRAAATRFLDRHAQPPTLLLGGRVFVRAGRNWHAKNGATALPH